MYRSIAFVFDRVIAEAASEAIRESDGGRHRPPLDGALGLAWRRAAKRADVVREALSEASRDELLRAVPERSAVLGSLPTEVRSNPLLQATRLAHLLARLRNLRAPAPVIEGTLRGFDAAVARLDPSRPYEGDPAPELALCEDARTHLHDFLEKVLRTAMEPARRIPSSAIDVATDAPPKAVPPLAAGWESTCYGMDPLEGAWHCSSVALARRFAPPDLTVLVGLGGGPATWATREDHAPERLSGPLSAAHSALGHEDALVSFVWCENDVEEAWM